MQLDMMTKQYKKLLMFAEDFILNCARSIKAYPQIYSYD